MTIRVGVNGFGSIGRCFYRVARDMEGFEIVAVNDLSDPETLGHLLKYDSNYGVLPEEVVATEDGIEVGDKFVRVLAEKDPANLPWADLGVEIVVESTGRYTVAEKAARHIDRAGAKKVIISAPAKGEDLTVVMGVNHDQYDPARHSILSNASCTTNALAPVAMVLDRQFGIEKGFMAAIHSYTNDQVIQDYPHKDLRRARAAALNIIPTTTGAASAISTVLPGLRGKLDGLAFRVPSPTVSVIDLTVVLANQATADDINDTMEEYSGGPLKGILGVTCIPLVSADFKGMRESTVLDGLSTQAMGDMAKVVCWYDNEWGYSMRLADLVAYVASSGLG